MRPFSYTCFLGLWLDHSLALMEGWHHLARMLLQTISLSELSNCENLQPLYRTSLGSVFKEFSDVKENKIGCFFVYLFCMYIFGKVKISPFC